jgi:hypothetical protein
MFPPEDDSASTIDIRTNFQSPHTVFPRQPLVNVGMHGARVSGIAFACWLAAAGPVQAHGFGERYDLPIPLWLYLAGAGMTVAVSFVMMALFMRKAPVGHNYSRIDVTLWWIGRALAAPAVMLVLRLVGVGLYLLIVCAGLFGAQSPLKNVAPAMVWAIWWVGMAYASALIGNLWAIVNPLDTLFAWAEALYARLRRGRRLALGLHYPAALGVWPAAALFLVFLWMEIVWEHSDEPAGLAAAMLAYSALTWLGMLLYGREEWLRRGEIFSLVFGLLSRFAPTEIRVEEKPGDAGENGKAPKVFYRKGPVPPFVRVSVHLRPYAVGLLTREPVDASHVVLVVLILAAMSFDGFIETPAWAAVVAAFEAPAAVKTQGLIAAPLIFLAVYLAVCRLTVWSGRSPGGGPAPSPSTSRVAGLYVLTLVPIAIAYFIAHYLSFLVMAAQYLIPLVSDPLGLGWDLFGTTTHFIRPGIIGARLVWYVSVAAIVIGHIAAVYLAHVTALRDIGDKQAALRSQYPMLVLMVGYTMLSLWIIAQPIVTSRTS